MAAEVDGGGEMVVVNKLEVDALDVAVVGGCLGPSTSTSVGGGGGMSGTAGSTGLRRCDEEAAADALDAAVAEAARVLRASVASAAAAHAAALTASARAAAEAAAAAASARESALADALAEATSTCARMELAEAAAYASLTRAAATLGARTRLAAGRRLLRSAIATWRDYARLMTRMRSKAAASAANRQRNILRDVLRCWADQTRLTIRAKLTAAAGASMEAARTEVGAQLQQLEERVQAYASELAREKARRAAVQEEMRAAFLRGVCALNFEALSLSQQHASDNNDTDQSTSVPLSVETTTLISPHKPHTPQQQQKQQQQQQQRQPPPHQRQPRVVVATHNGSISERLRAVHEACVAATNASANAGVSTSQEWPRGLAPRPTVVLQQQS
eukprot:jgi/Chlat1/5489/Chrsp36S05459